MSFSDNLPKLKPLNRSVSIVGVGVTPFRQTKEIPELNGITEGELFGYAAIAVSYTHLTLPTNSRV